MSGAEQDLQVSLLPAVVYPAGNQRALICCPDQGLAFVPVAVARALQHCGVFRTVEEHCQAALRERHILRDAVEPLRQTIFALLRRGFFVDRSVLGAGVPEHRSAVSEAVNIGTLALVTRDRPLSAAASLGSYLANSAIAARRSTVIVCDDSRRPESQKANLELGLRAQRSAGVSTRYMGISEKEAYAPHLAKRAGVPLETVRSAILDTFELGFTRGANTNALMLDTLGEAVFSFDDDSTCRLSRLSSDEGFELSSSHRSVRTLAFRDYESLLEQATEQTICLFEEHERWLGRSLRHILRSEKSVGCDDAGPALVLDAVRGRGRVSLSWSGIYGDSGSEFNTYYLTMVGADLDRLVESEDVYRAALERRILWKAPAKTRITRHPLFQSVAFALDNRRFLPPFLPFLRASDKVFGQMLTICSQESLIAHLPWSVLHQPWPHRQQSADWVWRKAGALRLAELVGICLQTAPDRPRGASGEERLKILGRHLVYLSRLAPAEFQALLYPTLMQRWTAELHGLDGHLRLQGERPSFWAEDVRQAMGTLERRLLSDEPLQLEEPLLSDDRTSVSARTLLRTFGEVAEAWPALLAAGLDLRSRGVRISRPLTT